MKKISLSIILCFSYTFLFLNQVFADTYFYSDSIYVYNIDDKKVELAVNPNVRRSPASLTKIMTTILSIEKADNLTETATISSETYSNAINSNATMSGLSENETVTVKDLMYGTMLPSAAECANTLAIYLEASQENFIKEMNIKAKHLGLKDTNFASVDGLDADNQYTTAHDIAKLVEYSIHNKDFYQIFTSETYTSDPSNIHPEGVTMYSTVLSKLHDYTINNGQILGGKSGTTGNAGLCWATLAEKDGKHYIIVVMGASLDSGNGQILDTLNILERL